MKQWKDRLTATMLILALLCVLALIRLLVSGRFDSVESLQAYMKSFGVFAPAALTIFQALQVVVPVLPGFAGCAVGSVLFGTAGGFWCNYIGICTGSIAAYYLARYFGIDLVLLMFSRQMYEKWQKRLENSRCYGAFLFAATLLPLFPDDFLCYFSGLMKMNSRTFIWIILLGKPWCILAYCIAFGLI